MADGRGHDAAGYLGWFFLGAVAGAAVALLMAPKSGRETREIIAERGGDLFRTAQGAGDDAPTRAGDLFERGREYFDEQTQRLSSAFQAGRAAMREEMDRGSSGG
jgi:gas vesicle protein